MVKVVVIGAGINGISCAVKIKEKFPGFEVVVLSKEFSPDTTGDGSGGLWYRYCCGNTPQDLLNKWGGETYRFLHACWFEGGHNVSLMPIHALFREVTAESTGNPTWASSVFGYQQFGQRQLEYLSQLYSADYVAGHTFTTFVAHTSSMLSYLYERFRRAGGVVKRCTVTSLRDEALAQFDVLVNCSGLGARRIVPDDNVFPIRGQVMRVDAPWLYQTIMEKSTCNYIIPNAESCVLGGTQQANDFNTGLNAEDTKHITEGCHGRVPALKNSKILMQWAGLRPARDEVRLEAEERDGRLVIHNYGHGGSGFTLFWGCASDVLELLQEKMNSIHFREKSKL